jgi:hypothetical protein
MLISRRRLEGEGSPAPGAKRDPMTRVKPYCVRLTNNGSSVWIVLLIRVHLNNEFGIERRYGVRDSALIRLAEARLVATQKMYPMVLFHPFRHHRTSSIWRIVIDHKYVQLVSWNILRFLDDLGQ